MFILGYIPAHNRVYLADKDMNIFGYSLSLSVVEYQTAVLRGDMDSAAEILPTLPKEQLNKVARFLEGRGMHGFYYILGSRIQPLFPQISRNLLCRSPQTLTTSSIFHCSSMT